MKKKVKRRFNFLRFITFIITLFILYIVISFLLSVKTKNIVILNNNYYNDEVIIEKAGIQDYPKFLLLNSNKVKKKIESLDLVSSVTVKKKLNFILEITVNEKKILYYNKSNNYYKLSDGSTYKSNDIYGVPTLINYIPEDIEAKFIKKFSKVNSNIISLISEIEYSKTEFDSERFLLYMSDENLVYITVSKIELLNKYIDIVKTLEGKKGILYLDSGNYFEIKEK